MQEITKKFSVDYPKNCTTPEAKAAYDLVKGKMYKADVELFNDLEDKPDERIQALIQKYGAGKAAHALVASLVIDFQAIIKRTAESKKGVLSKEEASKVCQEFDFGAPIKRGGRTSTPKPVTQDDINKHWSQEMANMTPQEAQEYIKKQADALRAQLQTRLSQK